jgi:DNA-binding CsgD family transcriptional regulator
MELEQKKLYKEIASNQKILTEISDALSEMTRAVETIRRVTETRMIQQMRSLLLPLVENLRQDKQLQIYEPSLTQLLHLIDDIHAGFPTNLPASPSLSVRELRTALMIKNGMTNQEIASHLHIALETVKAHRRNIRKKLGITGTKCTLGAYLQALDDDGTPGTES